MLIFHSGRMRFEQFDSHGAAFFWLASKGCSCLECKEAKAEAPPAAPPPPPPPPKKLKVVPVDRESALERAVFAVGDVETTGFGCGAVVIQMALGLFDAEGKMLGMYNRLWCLPRRTHIGKDAMRVHKITYAMLKEEGRNPKEEFPVVKQLLDRLLAKGAPVVFHNSKFDTRLLRQTAEKWGVRGWSLTSEQCVCTMGQLKEPAGITSKKTGKLKAPGNAELYRLLYGKEPDFGNLHDAATDIRVTAAVYVKAKSFGWL